MFRTHRSNLLIISSGIFNLLILIVFFALLSTPVNAHVTNILFISDECEECVELAEKFNKTEDAPEFEIRNISNNQENQTLYFAALNSCSLENHLVPLFYHEPDCYAGLLLAEAKFTQDARGSEEFIEPSTAGDIPEDAIVVDVSNEVDTPVNEEGNPITQSDIEEAEQSEPTRARDLNPLLLLAALLAPVAFIGLGYVIIKKLNL